MLFLNFNFISFRVLLKYGGIGTENQSDKQINFILKNEIFL